MSYNSEKIRKVTRSTPAWISYVDDQQRCRFSNRTYEEWFGRQITDIDGLHLWEVLGEKTYQQISTHAETALSGQSVNFDLELTDEDTVRWVNVSDIPHIPDSERVAGFFGLVADISDRKAIERMKDELISVVSHELRTPLTSIYATLQLFKDRLVEPNSERGRQAIQIATESTERLVRLVNDILDLERLESGKIKLSKQRVRAIDLMTGAVEEVRNLAERSQIEISVSAPEDIWLVVDRDRLIQVLTNLLSNAIKFSPVGSTVWLSVERQQTQENPDAILFAVRDRGLGIPADQLESVFERFHQVDASNSRHKGGTGLGLAICRQIIKQHDGIIWAESTPGESSSFYCTIPLLTSPS